MSNRIAYIAMGLFIFASTIAQPVITESSSPQPGDSAVYANDTIPDISFNMNNGPNQIWQIGSFDADVYNTVKYLDVSSTGFDTSSLVASTEYAIEIFPSTYIFVDKVRGSVNAEVSVALAGYDRNGEPFLSPANDPDTLVIFPVTYQDVLKDTGVYIVYYDTVIAGIPQQIPVYITVIHVDSFDAYGTFYMPSGQTFNVLRVNRFLEVRIEAYLLGNLIFADTIKSLELHFIADDTTYRYAIASAIRDLQNPDSLHTLSILNEFVTSADQPSSKKEPKFIVLKTGETIMLYADEEVIVEVYDIIGKRILKQKGTTVSIPKYDNTLLLVKVSDKQGFSKTIKVE